MTGMRGLMAAVVLLPFASAAQGAPGGAAPEALPEAPKDQAPSWPDQWIKRGAAEVAAVDKLSAQPTKLTIRAGGSAAFATLTIAVRSCLVRPPDQPADATAWIDVTDDRPNSPAFHGWILSGEPGLAVFQSPLYDLRLLGCR